MRIVPKTEKPKNGPYSKIGYIFSFKNKSLKKSLNLTIVLLYYVELKHLHCLVFLDFLITKYFSRYSPCKKTLFLKTEKKRQNGPYPKQYIKFKFNNRTLKK